MRAEMEIAGVVIPLWAVFLGVIILAIIVWKLIKFAIKILIIFVVFFAILLGLDLIGFFGFLQNLLSGVI